MYMLGGKTSSYGVDSETRPPSLNLDTAISSVTRPLWPLVFSRVKSTPPHHRHRVVTGAIACEAAGPWTALTAFQLWLYVCCSCVLVLLALSDHAPASLIPSPQISSSSTEFLSLFSPFCLTGLPSHHISDFFQVSIPVHLPITLKQAWPASYFHSSLMDTFLLGYPAYQV